MRRRRRREGGGGEGGGLSQSACSSGDFIAPMRTP